MHTYSLINFRSSSAPNQELRQRSSVCQKANVITGQQAGIVDDKVAFSHRLKIIPHCLFKDFLALLKVTTLNLWLILYCMSLKPTTKKI